ncbi:MAG: alpha-ketoglutarate-dependent dioxygenase AlkB [Marinicella sp.]|nr:alpha-ketoglutarate-dependent dioxygenase AlkB [Xanthomonadales bacterium]
MNDLFANDTDEVLEIYKDVYLLRKFTTLDACLPHIKAVVQQAPFRYMRTPGGKRLHISVTNCGSFGWISEPSGYRYAQHDPTSGKKWPAMPNLFKKLSQQVAERCNFHAFKPNACLINHYQKNQELTSHQDKNESDFSQPIVSVSLGMSARFQIYGNSRHNKPREIELYDGDVMVWGRSARLMYHGVKTNKSVPHSDLGLHRFNLTMRCA